MLWTSDWKAVCNAVIYHSHHLGTAILWSCRCSDDLPDLRSNASLVPYCSGSALLSSIFCFLFWAPTPRENNSCCPRKDCRYLGILDALRAGPQRSSKSVDSSWKGHLNALADFPQTWRWRVWMIVCYQLWNVINLNFFPRLFSLCEGGPSRPGNFSTAINAKVFSDAFIQVGSEMLSPLSSKWKATSVPNDHTTIGKTLRAVVVRKIQ